MRLTVPVCLVWISLVTIAPAADWPMGGRGGNRNPVSPETNAPTDWEFGGDGMKPRNIRWTAVVGSRAEGGPVVSGGLVWVGTNNDVTDEERPDRAILACFRESDGKPLYRYESLRRGDIPTDWPKQSLTGSPLADGDRLWFITNRREVVCLDTGPLRRGTGEPRVMWKLDMVGELKINQRALMIPWPHTLGSPAAYGEFLYVPTGNARMAWGNDPAVPAPDAPSLACIRKDTGKVVWSDNSPGRNLLFGQCASPLVIELAGRGVVIHPQADGWVRAFDAKTGKLIWKFDVNPKAAKGDSAFGDGDRVYVLSTPVYENGRVFFATGVHPEACGSSPGRLFAIDPTKNGDVSPELDAGNGQGKPNPNSAVVWEFNKAGPGKGDLKHGSVSSVAVHAGLVFAVDYSGYIHCLDSKTGKQHWSQDVKASVFGNPLVVDNKLYVVPDYGDVFVLEAAAVKRLIKKVEGNHLTAASPVFANGVLYVLTNGRLYAIAAGPAK
jgi:outer membrane protein assembly factor BamB